MTSRCTSCQAPICWARTTGGKPIPLDAEPFEGGNLVAVDRSGHPLDPARARVAVAASQATVTVARRALRSIDPELPHWRSHFATCPHADHHRTRTHSVARTTRLDDPVQDTLPL